MNDGKRGVFERGLSIPFIFLGTVKIPRDCCQSPDKIDK